MKTLSLAPHLTFSFSLEALCPNSVTMGVRVSTYKFGGVVVNNSIYNSILFLCCAVLSCSMVSDSAIPWTVAHQAPLSMGFSRQEYRSRLPFCSPGDLPNPGIESRSPALQVDSLLSEPLGKPSSFLFMAK